MRPEMSKKRHFLFSLKLVSYKDVILSFILCVWHLPSLCWGQSRQRGNGLRYWEAGHCSQQRRDCSWDRRAGWRSLGCCGEEGPSGLGGHDSLMSFKKKQNFNQGIAFIQMNSPINRWWLFILHTFPLVLVPSHLPKWVVCTLKNKNKNWALKYVSG